MRGYLRSTPINVSEKVRGDITDYGAWRKGAFGTLRLVKDGGIGVDTAYAELRDMAPGLFPEDITHPADQLRHILDTAKGIRAAEQSLDEFYGPDAAEFKRLTRRDFDEAAAGLVDELRQVKRYTDERTLAQQPVPVPATPQEAAELYRKKKGAQQVYQRAAAKNLLTEHDEIQLGRLLTLPTALTFGKSSLPTAREWAERGFKSMSAKQTACYQDMTELGVPQRDAFGLLQAIGDVEAPTGEDVAATEKAAYQKRKLLQEADIGLQGKGVVYYGLLASDKERTLMDGLEDKGEGARVLMELKDAGAEQKGGEMSAAKKNAIMSSSLSEEEKDAIFGYVLGKDSKGAAWSKEFAKAGLEKHSAAAAANAVNGLTPEKGKKTVSDAQKWRAVVDTVKETEGQKAALRTVMSDSARTRYEIGDQYGIQPETWVQVKEALPQFDENENGSYSGAEIEKAIDALAGDGHLLAPWDKDPIRLSREEKAVLWQLFTGSKSGSGNPYSTRVGKKVAGELERAREEAKKKEEEK